MGIERMTFVEISGAVSQLDDVLEHCLNSGIFQPENAAKLSEYSVGTSPLLRNPYGGLAVKINEMASQLNIDLRYQDFTSLPIGKSSRTDFVEQAHEYLNILRKEYPSYFTRKNKLNDDIMSYRAALEMLQKVKTPDINFDELFGGSFITVRFGKIPTVGLQKLEVYEDKPYALYPLSTDMGYTWCIYITAKQFKAETDKLFSEVGFVKLRIPDYVHGNAIDAISFVRGGLEAQIQELEETSAQIDQFVRRERETFLMVYSKNKFYHDAYDLRKYVMSIRDMFHLIGFVMTKDKTLFLAELERMDVKIMAAPAGEHDRVQTPVMLKNNWFTRPFEMFVQMYGTPSYNDIDPTPFVAYTYCLLFGMMFGDLGQGLFIILVGLFLTHQKKMQLGGILSRIGVSSSLFGLVYGSVFGYEHLLDPIFHTLGFAEKPIEIMHPDTTNKILIAAIVLGVAIIIMVILFNICVGIKHKDFGRTLFSHNGLAGLVFYTSVLYAAVMRLSGSDVLTLPYVLSLIVLPILLMFFREPIIHFVHLHSHDAIIAKNKDLKESTVFKKINLDITQLFTTQFASARFGRIPTDSYQKLTFYMHEPFMIYPLKTDSQYIWCIYAMASTDQDQVDAIFTDLYFERINISKEDLISNETAEAFIKSCIDNGNARLVPDAVALPNGHPKTLLASIFPEGIGSFILESFFEMFEVVLSFVTNTMSFLRVGGFILSHAGMMSVVMTLSSMVSGGASPLVVIVGNLFVLGLEGLIVGIQVLRLEFYEMFSRFFDAQGTAFVPVKMSYLPKTG